MESVCICSCHNYVSQTGNDTQRLPLVSNQLYSLRIGYIQGCTFRTLYGWMIRGVFGETWPEEGPPTLQAFTKSVERLKAKLTKLKKQHTGSDKEVEFLTENYTFPKFGVH